MAYMTKQVDEKETKATDKEQKIYDKIVSSSLKYIHAPKSSDVILQKMKEGDPVQGITSAAKLVTSEVVNSMQNTLGIQVDPEIIVNAGVEITEELIEVAVEAGVIQSQEAKEIESIQSQVYRAAFGPESFKEGQPPQEQAQSMQQPQQPTQQPQQQPMMGGQNVPVQ